MTLYKNNCRTTSSLLPVPTYDCCMEDIPQQPSSDALLNTGIMGINATDNRPTRNRIATASRFMGNGANRKPHLARLKGVPRALKKPHRQ